VSDAVHQIRRVLASAHEGVRGSKHCIDPVASRHQRLRVNEVGVYDFGAKLRQVGDAVGNARSRSDALARGKQLLDRLASQ
jgi:hypothetical protein